MSLGSRGSFAYPFLSPHRLVSVLLRLLTSCFYWRRPGTVLAESEYISQFIKYKEFFRLTVHTTHHVFIYQIDKQ